MSNEAPKLTHAEWMKRLKEYGESTYKLMEGTGYWDDAETWRRSYEDGDTPEEAVDNDVQSW